MKLTEMFQRVLIESGQFILPSGSLELDKEKFRVLVDICLGVQNKYDPIVKRVNITLGSSREYKFTENFSFKGEVLGIPDWVSDVTPIRISGVPTYFFNYQQAGNVQYKDEFSFEYLKPTLFVPAASTLDAVLVYKHVVTPIYKVPTNTNSEITDYEVVSIDNSNVAFFKLLTGKFMMAIGRSRTAFTLSEIQLQDDGGDMKSEGKAMEEESLQQYEEKEHNFGLGW